MSTTLPQTQRSDHERQRADPLLAIRLHMRPIGRLLACAVKGAPVALPEVAGFSRPGSWLEGVC